MHRIAAVCALSIAVTIAAMARADAKAEAERHFNTGVALLKAEDYEGAALSFEASVEFAATRAALFNLANCYKALRRYEDALDVLSRLRREFADQLEGEMLVETVAAEKEILSLVGTLRIEVDRAGASILVDGDEVGMAPLGGPLLLAPGHHEVTARLEGVDFRTESVRLLSGEEVSVRLAAVERQAGEPVFAENPHLGAVREGKEAEGRADLSPGWFWGMLALTATAGGATIAIDAALGEARRDLPSEADLERAERMQGAGASLLALTGAAAVATVVLAFFTDWSSGEEDAAAAAPAAWFGGSGAGIGMEGRF